MSLSHDVSRIVVSGEAKKVEKVVAERKPSLVVPVVQKSEKQTQITTLLYSKLKYDNFKVVSGDCVNETTPLSGSGFHFDSDKVKNSTSTPSSKRTHLTQMSTVE